MARCGFNNLKKKRKSSWLAATATLSDFLAINSHQHTGRVLSRIVFSRYTLISNLL
jgi:hypothetical protein